ncbi:hypothetical protein KP79_PYT25381 [Mizuhopecten yessoensis]|uniref:Uncharacterized protein n=1 Tax=Mizuhopecten yessoensis TaxID=6573 RepID=A0A210R107_MIZYE|nr:hypothetical protein KP79_PYT25381 [Mizuhopecten yessoensis]
MKSYADSKNCAREKTLVKGDTVMLKRDFKGNKLSTIYDPRLRTVTNTKGPMVTVTGNVTRNISRFKKIDSQHPSASFDDEVEELEETPWIVDTPQTTSPVKPNTPTKPSHEAIANKPTTPLPLPSMSKIRERRVTRQPLRFRDYEC